MKKVNFCLTEQQSERLKDLSTITGLKVSEIIRRAIDDYLARVDKKEVNIGC